MTKPQKSVFLFDLNYQKTEVFICFIFCIQAVYMCTFHCCELQVGTTSQNDTFIRLNTSTNYLLFSMIVRNTTLITGQYSHSKSTCQFLYDEAKLLQIKFWPILAIPWRYCNDLSKAWLWLQYYRNFS